MARQHAGTALISEGHKEVVNIRTAGATSNAQPPTLFAFVFLLGRKVNRTIRIRPNSLKLLFGTALIETASSATCLVTGFRLDFSNPLNNQQHIKIIIELLQFLYIITHSTY